jgi:hypothetical protein
MNRATTDLQPPVSHWLELVRAEFLEIPDMQLTRRQVQRMWGLDDRLCDAVLHALTESHFLHAKSDGHYIRADLHQPSARSRIRRPRRRT